MRARVGARSMLRSWTRVRAQRLRCVAGGAEDAREGHGETGGVGGRDQLFGIRPFFLTEPRPVGVSPLKDSVADGDGSGTVLDISVPLGAAVSCGHLVLSFSLSFSPMHPSSEGQGSCRYSAGTLLFGFSWTIGAKKANTQALLMLRNKAADYRPPNV